MPRTLVTFAVLAFAAGTSVAETNLLQNPGFATSLAPWTVPTFATGVWSSFDHGGGSGSAFLTSAGTGGSAPNTAVVQCVAATGSQSYAFGASIFVPAESAPAADITPIVDVRFFAGANCTGTLLHQQIGGAHRVIRDTWIDVQSRTEAPAGTVSAMVFAGALDYAADAATETIQAYVDDVFLVAGATCVTDASHLCLGGRFLVYGDWYVPAQDRHGYMRAQSATTDSGLFWFFTPDNLEVFVKVLDACSNPFNHYWVFASGLTNVQVSVHVNDTVSGQTRLYDNAAGTAFAPIQDTSAFATCP